MKKIKAKNKIWNRGDWDEKKRLKPEGARCKGVSDANEKKIMRKNWKKKEGRKERRQNFRKLGTTE